MKSNKEWVAWGKKDPLYAVATWEARRKEGNNPWTDGEFYALGASDWSDFQDCWEDYGLNPRHVLEVGCGAGRMTKQLAVRFGQVSAFDVSEDQLAYAKRNVSNPNVSFALTTGLKYQLPADCVSAAFSCHVFQHFYSIPDSMAVFAELYRVLEPGGTICIHLPLYSLPKNKASRLVGGLIRAIKLFSRLKSNCMGRLGKLHMRMTWYERENLVPALEKIGFESIEIRGRKLRSNGAWHDLLVARKPR